MHGKKLQTSNQGLTLAGVNTCHQNGITERHIWELQQMARTILLHAQHRWPQVISTNLWPYALHMANKALNATPSSRTKVVPLEAFANVKVASNPKHWHHFVCPAYALKQDLQDPPASSLYSHRPSLGSIWANSPCIQGTLHWC